MTSLKPELTLEEVASVLRDLSEYMDSPTQHLNDRSRRTAIEELLINAAREIKDREKRKARTAAIMLWGSIFVMVLTIGKPVLEFGKQLIGLMP